MTEPRLRAAALMGFDNRTRPRLTPDEEAILVRCRESFLDFLPYWQFKNRETGAIMSMASLWEGQRLFAELMITEPWILALKAGKLGFTELECAYDAWVALFRQPNARVHLFSLNLDAARELLGYVRFGLSHLPPFMQLPFLASEPGANTADSLKLAAGTDDVRTIVTYAASLHTAIDQSATHSHVDELARMLNPEVSWSSIETTVAPMGSCHIVTRGAGDANYVAVLWEAASSGDSRLAPFFSDWTKRPDRDRRWREEHAGSLTNQGLLFFAPESPEDALAGDDTAIYIPPVVWDNCFDPDLPPLLPANRTPVVLALDAAVSGDCFAAVLVSRHPLRHDDPAIRLCKLWRPQDYADGRIDFAEVQRWIVSVAFPACTQGHWPGAGWPDCLSCIERRANPAYNVVQITYDPYQLEQMAQILGQLVWTDKFDQGADRMIADGMLHKLALTRRLAHNGDPALREHVGNARAKLSKDDDSKMRIIKRSPSRKIDLVVAASMGVSRILYLNV